jgi:hypothetical protein
MLRRLAVLLLPALFACSSPADPNQPDPPGSTDAATGGDAAAPGKDGSAPPAGDSGTDGGSLRGPSVVITPVQGANTFDLGQANAMFAGAKITFDAALDTTGMGSVTATNIVIVNGSATGVRIYLPAWIVEDAQENKLAVTGLADVDESVPAGRKAPTVRSQVVVPRWAPGLKLRVAFSGLLAVTPTGVEGLPAFMYLECKSPQLFAPAVSQHWNKPTCLGCHGIFQTTFLGVDDKTACGLNKPLLKPGGPNLLRPTQSGHAGGIMPNAQQYTTALNAWKAGEP